LAFHTCITFDVLARVAVTVLACTSVIARTILVFSLTHGVLAYAIIVLVLTYAILVLACALAVLAPAAQIRHMERVPEGP
jgi:hypothetical protein